MQLQALIEKSGLLCVDAYTGTSLLGMYGRHGCVDEALEIFECMPKKNLVSWNIMISVLGQMGYIEDCIFMFTELRMSPVGISESTFVSVLSCLEEVDMQLGGANIWISEKMFENAPVKDTVSWNTIIGGMANSDRPTKALHLFLKMCVSGLSPNEMTLANVLHSCSRTQILSHGKCIHAKMIKKELLQLHSLTIKMGYIENSYVSSSLISSYARNGLVSDALIFVGSGNTKLYVVSSNIVAWIYNRTGQYEKTQELYAEMENPDSISWNLLIAAYSRNSDYNESFDLFDHMRKSQVYPDKYTFISLFNTNFKICDTFVCNTVIDMYGKCGGIESSVKIFDWMTEHNIISWTALISALGLHEPSGNVLVVFDEFGDDLIKTSCRRKI
ncbi:hypothetical protein ACS0TY_002375 [Phlomoides rotata]